MRTVVETEGGPHADEGSDPARGNARRRAANDARRRPHHRPAARRAGAQHGVLRLGHLGRRPRDARRSRPPGREARDQSRSSAWTSPPRKAPCRTAAAELVTDATRLIRDAVGIAAEAALHVWVLCHEIPEGSWGAGGQVVRFQALRDAAAAARAEAASAFEARRAGAGAGVSPRERGARRRGRRFAGVTFGCSVRGCRAAPRLRCAGRRRGSTDRGARRRGSGSPRDPERPDPRAAGRRP